MGLEFVASPPGVLDGTHVSGAAGGSVDEADRGVYHHECFGLGRVGERTNCLSHEGAEGTEHQCNQRDVAEFLGKGRRFHESHEFSLQVRV